MQDLYLTFPFGDTIQFQRPMTRDDMLSVLSESLIDINGDNKEFGGVGDLSAFKGLKRLSLRNGHISSLKDFLKYKLPLEELCLEQNAISTLDSLGTLPG